MTNSGLGESAGRAVQAAGPLDRPRGSLRRDPVSLTKVVPLKRRESARGSRLASAPAGCLSSQPSLGVPALMSSGPRACCYHCRVRWSTCPPVVRLMRGL